MRRAVSATNGPTSSARSIRNAAPRRLSSSQPPTPRSCPCIWRRSAGGSCRAATPPSSSMAPLSRRQKSRRPAQHHARPSAALRARTQPDRKRLGISAWQQTRDHRLRQLRRHSRQVLQRLDILRRRQRPHHLHHNQILGYGQSFRAVGINWKRHPHLLASSPFAQVTGETGSSRFARWTQSRCHR